MNNDLEKMYDESDPEKLAERSKDEEGSFLDLYRSLSNSDTNIDANLVNELVLQGIVPSAIRYGVLTTQSAIVYRGVAKSTNSELVYFNWTPTTDLKIVIADTPNKVQEASNYFNKCTKGCNLRKSDDLEDSEDTEKASSAGENMTPQMAATSAITEEQYAQQQQDVKVNPGSAIATTPDLPDRGRQWHENTLQASKSISELSTMLRSWGAELQATVPKVNEVTSLEQKFLKSINSNETELSKGINNPRLAKQFITWKGQVIKQRLSTLDSWLNKHK